MKQRFKMKEVQPAAYTPMLALEKYLGSTEVDPVHKELIKIRASQLNGCAYCINMHTKDARKLGETEQRIYLISVWREAGVFTEEEKVILELTEQVTLIANKGVTEELYEKAIAVLGEVKTAQVLMGIIAINAWNRIGVTLTMQPE